MFESKPGSMSYSLVKKNYENGKDIGGAVQVFSSTWTDTRSGSDNPYWRHQVATRQNATTNFSASRRSLYAPTFQSFMEWKQGPNKNIRRAYMNGSYQGLMIPTNPLLLTLNDVDLRARQKFVSVYREKRTAFQGGVFLGELMQTVRMIKNPAQALRRGIDDYYRDVKKRSRRKKSIRDKTKIVQDTWLEYTFGWRPLIRDVQDALRLATQHPYAVSEPIEAFEMDESRARVRDAESNGFLSVIRYGKRSNRAMVRYKGACYFVNQPPGFPEQLGLSWSNLAPTIWELIPYSFLVDYFTNIGKVIEGVSTGKIALAWGCRTARQESDIEIVSVVPDMQAIQQAMGGQPFSVHASGSGKAGLYAEIVRTKITSVSVGLADLTMKLPGTNTRWLNIAALAQLRR